MKANKSLSNIWRSITVTLLISLFTTFGIGQSIIVTGSGSFTGDGTINVKGNINTNLAGGAVTIPGRVVLNGTATLQQLGVAGGNALTFDTLIAVGTIGKQADVNITVKDSLRIETGGPAFDIQGTTLTLGGISKINSGSLDVTDNTSTVIYNSNVAAQTVLGLPYAGNVILSNNGLKNFGGTTSVGKAFTHTGGNVTINNNVAINGTGNASFATIANVTGTSTLTLATTGTKSIAAIATTTSGSVIDHTAASGLLTITTLSGNAGAINTGAGGVEFTNAATNSGNIGGGAGPVSFGSTLNHSTGTITAGSGGIAFGGVVTYSSGTITSASSGSVLAFGANVVNSGTAVLSLTSSGAATFAGAVASTGLSFAPPSTVTFNGASQVVPSVTYGNLTLGGTGTASSPASFAVAGNLILNQDLNMFTGGGTLSFANEPSTVTGTYEVIGAVSRTHDFAISTPYAFNRQEVTASFAALQAADMTITMQPGISPSGVGANYVQRKYGVSSSAVLSTNNMDLKLYYTDTERQGTAVTAEARMGIRGYDGITLSKYSTNVGAYTRVDGVTNTIALTKLNVGLGSIQEFALVPITYATIASGPWTTTGTWGSTLDDIPTATDDATIGASHTIAVPTVSTIANLTIASTGGLSVNGANFTATSINNSGNLSVSVDRTLLINGGDLTNNGAVTNAGTITIQ